VRMVSNPLSMSPAVAMGWLVGFQGIAMALAMTIGGLLAERFGIQDGMLILAAVPVFATVLIGLRLPKPERDVEAVPAEGDSDEPMMPATRGGSRAASTASLAWSRRPRSPSGPRPSSRYLNVMNGILQSFFPLLALALTVMFSIVQIGTLSSMRSAVSAATMMTAGLDVGKLVGPLLGGFLAVAVGLESMFRIVPISFLALYAAAHLVGARRRVVRAVGPPPS
jgi:MFS family permease